MHNSEQCANYVEMATIEMYQIPLFEVLGRASFRFPTNKPRTTYIPLLSAADWKEYYFDISDKKKLLAQESQQAFTTDLRMKAGLNSKESFIREDNANPLQLKLASDTGARNLCILAALEDLDLNIAQMEKITIHFIGASAREMTDLPLAKELLHLPPKLMNLEILLAGSSITRRD